MDDGQWPAAAAETSEEPDLTVARHQIRGALAAAFNPLIAELVSHVAVMDSQRVASLHAGLRSRPHLYAFPWGHPWLRHTRIAAKGLTVERELRDVLQHMEYNANRRNRKLFPPATGRFKDFLWASTDIPQEQMILTHVVAPIGQYGPEHAHRLLETARILIDVARQELAEASATISDTNPAIPRYAARGQDPPGRRHPELAPMATLIEGVITTMSCLALMTAEKGPHSRAEDAVSSIAATDAISRIARRAPMGVIQPLIFRGRYIPGIIEWSISGEASLSESVEASLVSIRDKRWDAKPDRQREVLSKGITAHGCPVAGDPLNAVTRAFNHVFQQLDLRELGLA